MENSAFKNRRHDGRRHFVRDERGPDPAPVQEKLACGCCGCCMCERTKKEAPAWDGLPTDREALMERMIQQRIRDAEPLPRAIYWDTNRE